MSFDGMIPPSVFPLKIPFGTVTAMFLPERVRDAFEPPAADDPSTAMAAPSSEFSTAIVRDSVSSLP